MHNTRRSKGPVTFDPEIEKTARKQRKQFLARKAEKAFHLDKLFGEEEYPMAEKPLKQLATPDVTTTPLSIPNMHLIAFDLTCSSMECEGVKSDDIKLCSFPFSLEGTAKEWLFYLPSEKFQRASRVASIRMEISGIKQGRDESLCGGMLAEKTAMEARALINNMALNTQQFSTRRDVSEVSAISDSDFISVKNQMQENAQQIATLTTLRICFCQSKLFEDVNGIEGFNNQSYKKYDPYLNTYNKGWKDHLNHRYGFGPKALQNNFRQHNSQPSTSLKRDKKGLLGNKEMMKQLTNTVSQVHNQSVSYQQKTDAHLHQLDTQMSQICTTLSNIETTLSGKLSAQPILNPKDRTTSILELGDGSTIQPLGVLENIIVKVGNFEFMNDFYTTESHLSFLILLGKPFLRSSRAIIDVAKDEVILKCAQKELKITPSIQFQLVH
ncbi:hypothetical protein RND81_04G057000 [Saponaria officinalis]|uniref:Uncharacterized protein n=1 Tax=Saponaria officinalis TaxID=3572 RepID=A0AAW1LL91_SAPOF